MMRLLPPAIVGLSVVLGGCSLFNFDRERAWLEARPIQLTSELSERTLNPYYDRATAALARRDYARALDLLQRARARDPSDIRVLNAFGVVYDKLGRFDLSARYYSQALLLDPGSTVVAQNLAYSQQLQHPARDVMMASAAAPGPAPEPDLLLATVAPGGAMPVPAGAEPPLLLRRPFEFVWALPQPAEARAEPRKRAAIGHPEPRSPTAPALPRSLPAPVEYSACTACLGHEPPITRDDFETGHIPLSADLVGQRIQETS